MKQVAKVLMVALFASAIWTSSAQAELAFFRVTIDLVGQQTANVIGYRLTHVNASPDFVFKRFQYTGPLKKEYLAVSLTAVAADIPVFVQTDPAVGAVPEILQMFLQK
jgi:hypothetical protein